MAHANLPAGDFPWTSTTTDDANFAPAMIGQLKAVFSLDFTADRETGSEADAIPDLWEWTVFHANPADAWASISQIHRSNARAAAAQTGQDDLPDFDKDGIADPDDADPREKAIDWPRVSEASRVWLPLNGYAPSIHGPPVALSNTGIALFAKAVWKNGTWKMLEWEKRGPDLSYPDEPQGSVVLDTTLRAVDALDLSDDGRVVGRAEMLFDDPHGTDLGLPGTSLFAVQWTEHDGRMVMDIAGEHTSGGLDLETYLRLPWPVGVSPDGVFFSMRKSKANLWQWARHEPGHWNDAPSRTFNRVGSEFVPYICYGRVFSVARNTLKGGRMGVWNPDGATNRLLSPDGEGTLPSGPGMVCGSLADGRVAFLAADTSPGLLLLRPLGEKGDWRAVPGMAGTVAFNARGEAISHDGRFWQNGKWLAPVSEGISHPPGTMHLHDLNDHGAMLASAGTPAGNGQTGMPHGAEAGLLLPVELKVTDFPTKSDAVPYAATTNATPPENSELCLKADKTNEKAKIEIELPSITDTTMLSKMKWKVVQKPADTLVSEGIFGGATPPSVELSLGSGSSVEDDILFEVQVGVDEALFTPTDKMNVRVVRDRLNWWFESFIADVGWRTAKPEPRADTGDYPAHKANAYKRESLQSVYEFFKSTTAIGPSTPKANWVKPAITCFGEFHNALKAANGNNPLVDLTSLARIDMTAATELASFDLKYGALRSAQGRQTTYPTDDKPTLRATQFPERVQWATAAANAIGSANLPRGRLLAIWQKEGSMRLNTQSSTTTKFDANLAASELGAAAPTSSDNAKVCYIYNATYQCLGSDFLIQTYRIGGAGDNIPDLRDYAAAMAHIRSKADQIGGAGSGDKLFNALTGTAAGTGYTVSVNAPAFYEELLRLVGLFYLAGWQPEGPEVSYMVYNMGTTSFTNLKNTLGNAAYPERARLGLTDWAIHYEIRPTEYTQPRDHAQKFYAYRVAFEAKYP